MTSAVTKPSKFWEMWSLDKLSVLLRNYALSAASMFAIDGNVLANSGKVNVFWWWHNCRKIFWLLRAAKSDCIVTAMESSSKWWREFLETCVLLKRIWYKLERCYYWPINKDKSNCTPLRIFLFLSLTTSCQALTPSIMNHRRNSWHWSVWEKFEFAC